MHTNSTVTSLHWSVFVPSPAVVCNNVPIKALKCKPSAQIAELICGRRILCACAYLAEEKDISCTIPVGLSLASHTLTHERGSGQAAIVVTFSRADFLAAR